MCGMLPFTTDDNFDLYLSVHTDGRKWDCDTIEFESYSWSLRGRESTKATDNISMLG